MSTQPTPRDDHHAQDAQSNRDALNELRDIGMRFVRTLDAQREAAAEDPNTTVQLTAAFHRAARDVRLTALLLERLDDPARATQLRTAARTRIIRSVEDAIHQEAEGQRAERLRAELHERLDAPDLADILDDDIQNRPIADIIADIRRDLGIAGISIPGMPPCNPYKRRTPADIAALHARAAQTLAARPSLLPLPSGEGRGEGHAAPDNHPDTPERLFRIIATPNSA